MNEMDPGDASDSEELLSGLLREKNALHKQLAIQRKVAILSLVCMVIFFARGILNLLSVIREVSYNYS